MERAFKENKEVTTQEMVAHTRTHWRGKGLQISYLVKAVDPLEYPLVTAWLRSVPREKPKTLGTAEFQ
jgi:hypothetical protein